MILIMLSVVVLMFVSLYLSVITTLVIANKFIKYELKNEKLFGDEHI